MREKENKSYDQTPPATRLAQVDACTHFNEDGSARAQAELRTGVIRKTKRPDLP